jgi:hypothetical protein
VYDWDYSAPGTVGVDWNGEFVWGYPVYETKIVDAWGNVFDSVEDYQKARDEGRAAGTTSTQDVLVNVIPAEKVIVDYNTVVDKAAWDEEIEVKDYQYCSECGQRK